AGPMAGCMVRKILNSGRTWHRAESGISVVSYALMLGLIGVVALSAFSLMGNRIDDLLDYVGDVLVDPDAVVIADGGGDGGGGTIPEPPAPSDELTWVT